MKLHPIITAIAIALSASLTCADEVSMSLEATTPQILPSTASRYVPPTPPVTLSSIWLPPKHTDVILPLGTSWSLPPLIPTKTIPYSASPETFISRMVGRILYAKPESITAHP